MLESLIYSNVCDAILKEPVLLPCGETICAKHEELFKARETSRCLPRRARTSRFGAFQEQQTNSELADNRNKQIRIWRKSQAGVRTTRKVKPCLS